jgi:hypothetical protein
MKCQGNKEPIKSKEKTKKKGDTNLSKMQRMKRLDRNRKKKKKS